LGVRGERGGLAKFVCEGLTPAQSHMVGHPPEGHGLLGLLIENPKPVRLSDLRAHPASVGFPKGHPPMGSFLGVPIMMRDTVFGSIYLSDKHDGGEFSAADEAVLQVLATAAAVAIENAHLFEQSREQQRWLLASSDITASLLGGHSLDENLERLTEHVHELASAAAVYLLVAAGHSALTVAAATGKALVDEISWADSGFDSVRRSRERLLLADAPALPLLGQPAAKVAALPINSGAGLAGLLVVTSNSAAPWTRAELDRLESMADLAAVAIEFADRQLKQRLFSVLADRDRIGRDLHDNVIQRLFATGMSLQAALAAEGVPERVREVVQATVEQLDRTVREIRTTIFDLQTSSAESAASLRRRLLDVVADVSAMAPVTPSVRFSGAIDTLVPGHFHEHAEAVLREALSNALRHAKASRVDVAVSADSRSFTLVVADDGAGLGHPTRCSGIGNMARRAELCGGEFSIGPGADGGTTMCWSAPLPE
jgi:signal transduction histidine kinase